MVGFNVFVEVFFEVKNSHCDTHNVVTVFKVLRDVDQNVRGIISLYYRAILSFILWVKNPLTKNTS